MATGNEGSTPALGDTQARNYWKLIRQVAENSFDRDLPGGLIPPLDALNVPDSLSWVVKNCSSRQ